MIQVVMAIFEGGVFKPDQQPALVEGTRVHLIVELAVKDADESLRQGAWADLQRLWQDSAFDSHVERLSRDQLHERR